MYGLKLKYQRKLRLKPKFYGGLIYEKVFKNNGNGIGGSNDSKRSWMFW